jgi:hypothetical protein
MSKITPLFHITLPDLDDNSPESHFAPLVFALEGLIAINMHHIKQSHRRAAAGMGVVVPPMYESGVRYAEDDPGHEDWRDVYTILQRGLADCDNLIGWRVAELRVAGIAAEPVIKWQQLPRDIAIALGYAPGMVGSDGLWLVHCCVRFPDGSIEDPSKELGMGGGFSNHS